jgi:2,3-dihydroxybiphenyl 1,2-dioxygenase
MKEIFGLGYVGLEASDLAGWATFGADVLGLETAEQRRDGTLIFRIDEYAYRISVRPGPSDDVAFLGWEVCGLKELEAVAARVRSAGVTVTEEPAAVAVDRNVTRLISFVDPDGMRSEVFYGPLLRPEAPFNSPRGLTGFVTGRQGLGHVVLFPNDLDACVRFYCDVLGFRVSDYIDAPTPMGMLNLTFLHCSSRHHSLAFGTRMAPRRLAHVMLQAATIDDVGMTCDLAQRLGSEIVATIGRHSNDRMLSFYMRTPSGWDIEFGCDGVEIDDDVWHVRRYDRTSIWGHHRARVPIGSVQSNG